MSAPSNWAEIQGELRQFATLVFFFASWVALLLIARDSLLRVKVGLIARNSRHDNYRETCSRLD